MSLNSIHEMPLGLRPCELEELDARNETKSWSVAGVRVMSDK